ncbi:MAG TPA: PIN domain-containing protein [Gemmatimonadales bacterium]|jgi:PIN domain nuclease of toxin-antitoxin system|nr:PIN domain-containing protein [Gemmatimonadales bacterium]
MIPRAVTDTHPLIWVVKGQLKRLGRDARRFFESVDSGESVLLIPTMVLVEIGEAAHRNKVGFAGQRFADWLVTIATIPNYQILPLTLDVVLIAESLHAIPERGDRLIAATAMVHGCPLITRDPEIARVADLPLLW